MVAPSSVVAPTWEFHLPLSAADLLRSDGPSQYAVQEVLPVKELRGQLSGFQAEFRTQGSLAILQHFDTIYSILHHFSSVEAAVKEDTLELMLKVVSNHSSTLTTILDSADLVPSLRAVHCNALKMNCYGLVRLAEAFETEPSKSNLVGLDPKRKSKKSQGTSFLWEEERQHVLQLLTQLLQLDLHRLWTSSIVEEEFVSLMTGCCYHILENPGIGHQKHRPTREAAIHLLGVALRRYDHMLSATLKVTQMLQHFEHVAPVFVEAVSLWIKEYGMRSIVGELLREIGQKCPQELARDTSATKGYASFLTELAEQVPAVVLANMSVLLHHLDGESYGIRNAILAAMAEMLLQVLNGEQLEDAARSTRDQFLDTLQAHTCDVHGLVRSRMLQLFTRIVQQKALPLTRFQQSVVCLAVSRLQDKSVTVVKNAIQLLAAFLSNNPFSCKLSCTDLTELLQKERKKLQEMRDKFRITAAVTIPPEEEWEAMQPELQATVKNCLGSQLQGEEAGDLEVGDPAQVSDRIIQLLRKSSYKDAVLLVQGAIHCFQETEPFVNCTRTEEEDEEDFLLRLLRTLYTGPQPRGDAQEPIVGAENTEGEEHGAEGQPSSELAKQEMLVQYLQDAYNFSAKITDAMSLISRMMYESSISVVQEAIEFFVIVSQFGIPQAVLGVRRMLPLIWSKEPGIREAVLNAYRRLYLKPSGGSERARAHSLLQSLSLLMVDASLATIQCLGEIISEFVQKDEIKPAVVQLLWEQFTEKSECSALERHAAIMLLGMMARGKPEIVGSNLDILVTVGLDDRVHENYRLAQEVCNAISKITSGQKPALGKSGTPIRLPQSHLLFERLSKAVIMGFVGSSPHWIPFTETAITLIYQLAEEPEEVCTRILQHCSQQTLEKLGEVEGTEAEPGSSPTGGAGDSSHVDALLLTHLVSLAGDVALQQLVHLELAVSAELRRRRILGEEQEMKERTGSNVKDVRIKSTGNETTMEMELGLVGASAEDTEAELIRSICETELLEGKQLLSTFVPLVLKICNNPGHYSDPALSAAAALALGKFCMVSAEFCDAHLRLLFTMMEKSALPSVRANLMIVAGDLAIRFPNQVEPWTPHLYARLRDPCHQVRRTAALVMTHLILKDMVKVKGQVSEMAALLIDPEEEIVALARNFFAELSGKDNAVYNLLPDIISRLSDPDSGIEEQPFRTIMRQLFSYVTKDRQTESLVEKLCQRFRTARTERQHRDLGFCLTLLPLTDRGLRKMQDNFECFGDKLQDAAVYSCFQTALGRLRRLSTKPEMKTLVEEFEQKLQKCHNRGLDSIAESPTESRCPGSNSRPAPQTAKRTATSSRRQRKPDSSFITPQPRVSRAHRKISKQVYVVFSSDEGNSPEEAELSEDETPSKTTPISRASSRRVQ
ncbi:LOW QUALITY PROTEIN: condensin complex subunit 1 [Sphaerodactylus townsendi]|uniref:LOW QUALITY PROTEIN: condensin complex subunit 1 n=1 Tax=Sphaerodactylus townsendi TaxID=933632 RepID=UPI0020276086|nr:LOW QUALITY PROTEIN: condensin complex subunit 1 [Sphaerodactylus townsendi]